ncbi:MAG: secretion system protein [Candidatus Riflebacteria bacterium]|nr:secretion system protein [Candidatus Riflebacteria bacterium]
MLELIFVGVVGVGTLTFVLLLFSIFGKPPGEDVRARMEQYLVESEMAARAYVPPEDDEETRDEAKESGESDDDWLREGRGETTGVKKLLFNVGSLITPKGQAARIAENLAKADIPLRANEFVAIKFLAGVGPFLLLTAVGNGALGFLIGVLGFFGPNLYVTLMKRQRVSAFNDQILDTLIMLANGLKAGYSLLQAMEMVAREAPPPMSSELRRVLKENSLGLNLEDCLRALNGRVESEDWDLVTTVVLIQRQVGGNLAEILDKIGATIRQRMKIKGDIQTKTAQAKISGLLVGVLPFALGFMIFLLNPEFISRLFTFKKGPFRGWFVVVAGLIWEMIGLYIIMKIVDIEV